MDDSIDIGYCFCGAKLVAKMGDFAVTHSDPVCTRFVEADLLDFLSDLRRSRGVSDKEFERMNEPN